MVQVRNVVGRLVEITLSEPVTPDDVDALESAVEAARARHGEVLVLSDLRGAGVLDADTQARFARLISSSPRALAGAAIADTSAFHLLQMRAIFRAVCCGPATVVTRARDALAALAAAARPDEQARASAVLGLGVTLAA